MRRSSVFAALATSVALATVSAVTIAGRRWRARTVGIVARLYELSSVEAPPFSREELAGLPAAVERYLAFALAPGQRVVCNARLRQTGEFALRAGSWRPFTAVEYFTVVPPSLLWDARIRAFAAISFFVRDGYVAGEGEISGALAGLFRVVRRRGTRALASGELLRYLAEAVFMPTALLPRNGISWTAIDADRAEVSLTDGATTVSCVAEFGGRGEIVRMSAERYRDANGRSERTHWVGHYEDYREIDGMMVPTTAEVAWILPDGPFPYWRGRIAEARYEFAAARAPSRELHTVVRESSHDHDRL